ncbi:hypothetical protein LTR65_006195 [Meristemomyces frigidus]
MSWLSPKRRRTTGNLKTLQNSQANNNATNSANGNGNGSTDTIPGSPPSTPRQLSQPVVLGASQVQADGNLFYAYARRDDDIKSRYLLTFASAAIANEWWALLQANFTACTRPGPQLFSFQDAELLPKAWKHPLFAHLKSKWMYISFSDTASTGLGGAAQGIIPVQDAQGNMLGGSAPASPELLGKVGQVRREAQEVRHDITKLEGFFERMMEAVERNTEQIAALTANQAQQRSSQADIQQNGGEAAQRDGYFDAGSELSSHLGRINDLLARNSEHVEGLAQRQQENDEKLRATLQEFTAKQHEHDHLDMSQLAAHLDRIQTLMEQSASERQASAKELLERQARAPPPPPPPPPTPPPPQPIDFSPLTDRLEKVQEAVEQNSALVKALLDESNAAADSKPGTPFWGKETPVQQLQPPIDLSPLTDHLQKIHAAIEQQSAHISALVGFASGGAEADANGGGGGSGGEAAEKSLLAPLGEHLEQIYNAIEEGNKHARSTSTPAATTMPTMDLQPLLDAQNATRAAVESGNSKAGDWGMLTGKLDGLIEHLMATHGHSQRQDEHLQAVGGKLDELLAVVGVEAGMRVDLDLAPLIEKFDGLSELLAPLGGRFDGLGEVLARLAGKFDGLGEHLEPLAGKFDGLNEHLAPLAGKFDGLNEHLESLREWAEYNAEQLKELVDAQHTTSGEAGPPTPTVDLAPLLAEKFDGLGEHLQALLTHSDEHAETLRHLLEAQQLAAAAPPAPPPAPSEIDFTPLTERLNRIHDSLERQAQQTRDVSPRRGSGDPKFILSALTSHLSKIQAVTEANAQHVKTLREKQSASQDKMHIAVSQTADTVRSTAASLAQYQAQNAEERGQSDARVEATNGQVRELMAGQRELVEVMRELARSLVAAAPAGRGACGHVVVPPPRKVGRRIVGFVYDGKEGSATVLGGWTAKEETESMGPALREAFLRINEAVLKRYAACGDEEEVKQAEADWLAKIENECWTIERQRYPHYKIHRQSRKAHMFGFHGPRHSR